MMEIKVTIGFTAKAEEILTNLITAVGLTAGTPFVLDRETAEAVAEGDFQKLANSDPEPAATAEPDPAVESTPAEKPAAEKPETVHTRDQVKAFCAKAKTEHGVNIPEIIRNQFGVKKFSEVPDDKLEELYEAVEKAVGNA